MGLSPLGSEGVHDTEQLRPTVDSAVGSVLAPLRGQSHF